MRVTGDGPNAAREPNDDAARRDALRLQLRGRRRSWAPDAVATAGAAIVAAIRGAAAWQRSRTVAAFVGVGGEPPTWDLLGAAWTSGKTLVLPRVRGNDLEFVTVADRSALVPGCFGLIEPAATAGPVGTLAELAPDLVVVPGLAFGRRGERIGFGRGFYDRALAPLRDRADVLRVGVCFAEFLDPKGDDGPLVIPMAAHDVPMHAVVTEHGWHAVAITQPG